MATDGWPDHPIVQGEGAAGDNAAWPDHPLASGAQPTAPPASQLQGAWRNPAMIGSNVLGGALAGAGAIGDVADWGQGLVNKYLADPLYRAVAGREPPPPMEHTNPLSSTSLLGAGRAVGAVDNPALTPQDAKERYMAATAQGVGGALPYLWMGGINPTRALIGGGAGGAAGEAGAELVPEHPAIARAVGNILGGAAVGGAPRAAPNETARAFDRLRIDNPLPGDVAGGWRQRLTPRVADMPMGGSVRTQQRAVVDQWGRAIDDIAGNIAGPAGVPQTAQQAGSALQAASINWLDRFNNQSRQLWGDVDMHIPPATPMPVTNYERTLNNIAATMPAAPAQARVLQPDFTRNLLDGLRQDLQTGPLDWQSISGIRTRIGTMLSDPQLIGGPNVTDLRRLYGALSSDMEAAAHGTSPEAAQAFRDASNFTRAGHQYIDNTVSNFIGRKGAVGPGGVDPEDAYRAAMAGARRGGTVLQSIRDDMPEAADQLAAYELRARAQATPGQQGVPGQGQTLSPTTFVTRTNPGNLSQEARDALFPASTHLDDLRTTAGAMRETERSVNKSGTGPFGSTKEMLDVVRNLGIGAGGGYATAGLPGAAIGGVGALAAPFVPGLLGSYLVRRQPRNYPGLLQYPARGYGGAVAPQQP